MNSNGRARADQSRAVTGIFALFLGVATLVGCASHSDKTKEIRSALDAGQPRAALKLLNEQLDVDSEKELPEDTGGDNSLFLLDRAMVLQQLQLYKWSSRDLEVSDKQIDMLDFSRNTAHDIGKYLFSDDVGPYKAPPYEKLMINTMNMVNYLVQGDLQGARVEARRLAVMQKYLKDNDPDNALTAPGSYLAGFTFEKSGQYDEALRYYDEALQYGEYRSLAEPVRRLSGRSGYSSPRLKKLAGLDGAPTPAAEQLATQVAEQGELLVIVSYGRVPAKIARRIPIGLALTYASGALSPGDRGQANELAVQGLVTWVNFPDLGKAHGQYDTPTFSLDGKLFPLEGIVAVDHETKRAWEDVKGTVVASAITRMIARVVAGKGVQAAAGDENPIAGLLLGLATQATLTAADTPDTRSWATLPARMAFGRVMLPAGTRAVQLNARGAQTVKKVTIKPGGFAVVNLTVLE
jgi:tetratricopeptide (TPR) repeat protein